MPKPIITLSEDLRQFIEHFRSCFTKRQWKYFVTVLLGLVECQERRTLTGLLRVVAEKVSLSGLSRFLSRWPWKEEALVATWYALFCARMMPLVMAEHIRQRLNRPKKPGRPRKTVVTGFLVLDDSVHTKPKGRKMEGIGRHYSATEKKVVTGHCLFQALYILLGRRCPLLPKLYRQKAVCEREKVPFKSKVDLAVETIETFQPVAETHTHVVVDAWYHNKRVRRAARKRDWDVSGGLKSNRKMRIILPNGQRIWVSLSEYAATLKPEDWQEAIWPSQEGGRKIYVHAVCTWIRKLGPTLLLITRESLDAPLSQARYWGSTLLDADAQTVINILAIRWDIEVFFEDIKDLLGSDHYQVMKAKAVVRLWTLINCLWFFLEEQRATLQELNPDKHITRGDVRRYLQREHQQRLLEWLYQQFQSGASPDKIYNQLAA